ncbi:uncharacterized protein VICG_00337 [Vittaforma corneae ATCC 50505]|uniref:C2H2-type domain-containing protein n=1 Tax=Vittaforma corneae (strain ATCC 50505) TaxID=993615 RepID=L2GQ34_VITCO|nr:uncharacterized protein VICG_00337 [Vittaforma corneae ATCC 50505]ELA42585.1 hypothetical protein VICG_00337 [Vittaforma corneae ATCC 50505]
MQPLSRAIDIVVDSIFFFSFSISRNSLNVLSKESLNSWNSALPAVSFPWSEVLLSESKHSAHKNLMEDRIAQMLIGHNPPFLVKNLIKHTRIACKNPIESECSYFCIQDNELTREMSIKAFIHNRNTTISRTIRMNEPIVTFSCFDEIHLFLYYIPNQNLQIQAINENQDQEGETTNNITSFKKDNKCHVFYTKINCCRNWDRKQLKAVELDFISRSNNYINIPISISNARKPNDCHYNVCQETSSNTYTILMESQCIIFPCFQCPLCFRLFRNPSVMKYHINYLHINYELGREGKNISLKKIQENVFANSHPIESDTDTHPSMHGIEFYSKTFFDEYTSSGEDSVKNYIDFYADICIESESKGNYNVNKKTSSPIKDTVGNLVNDKVKCKNYLTERLLVIAIFNAKYTGKKEGITAYLLQLKPLSKETKGQKQFKPIPNFFLTPIFEDTVFLNQKYLKKTTISFMRKRKTKLLEYCLQNYGLLIEREFDTLNYSSMLSKHLNLRIKEHLFTLALSPKMYKLMKAWNSVYIENLNLEKALYEIVSSYGMIDEIIEFIELLYTRGLLNSEEIMKILNKIQ